MANTSYSQTVKNENRSQNRDFNIFTEEYFGGSDVFIYVNGKRSHNIAAINFQIAEQHKPIYGYGSRTFDDLAVGSRIVSGAIRIPIMNTAESDFGDTWGKATTTQRSASVTVPEWVYSYAPQKMDNTIAIKNETNDTVSVIAQVQERMALKPTGFMDENTRKSITSYRKTNEMMLGTLIDNELLTSLGVEDYECIASRATALYDSPMRTRSVKTVQKDEKLVYLASNEETVLVRTASGMSGYVNIGDIYRL